MSRWLKDRINHFVDNLVWYIFGAIIVIASSVVAFFWKLLKATHLLEMPGWAWVVTIVVVMILPLWFSG